MSASDVHPTVYPSVAQIPDREIDRYFAYRILGLRSSKVPVTVAGPDSRRAAIIALALHDESTPPAGFNFHTARHRAP